MRSRLEQFHLKIMAPAGGPPGDTVTSGFRQALEQPQLEWGEVLAAPSEGGRTTTLELRLAPPRQEEAPKVPFTRRDRVFAHCDLLDRLKVPNGTKAIAIALHRHWSESLRDRYGEPAEPATVKKWRTARSRRLRGGRTAAPPPRRLTGPERVVRGLRRHYAIRVNASGSGIREGYRRAMADVRLVNEGGHRFYGRPDRPLPSFSYEAFRLECHDIRLGGGGTREDPER